MQLSFPRALRRRFPAGVLCLALAACGGGDAPEATPEDVDMDTPVAITEEEEASFTPPADSLLTPAQVEGYLKTSVLQFDLIRKESAGIHQKLEEMKTREEKGGTLGQLRNMVAAGQTMYQVTDLVGGSYIRSARALGHNPAEMEWVREQMAGVAGYLTMKPMYESAAQGAVAMRAQAEELRKQLGSPEAAGFTEADIEQMIASANEAEQQALSQGPPRAVLANLEVLRKTRPAVTDAMWGTVGFAGGASGLVALTGLADPSDAEAQRKLDEFRRVYEDALANRVSQGMENTPAQPQS